MKSQLLNIVQTYFVFVCIEDKRSNFYKLTEKGRKELKILAEKLAVYLP